MDAFWWFGTSGKERKEYNKELRRSFESKSFYDKHVFGFEFFHYIGKNHGTSFSIKVNEDYVSETISSGWQKCSNTNEIKEDLEWSEK